jgi:hypothetical protein
MNWNTQGFAKVMGWLFLVVGIFGFIPGFVQDPYPGAPEMAVHTGYGYLFGLFPVNVLHNLVHIGIGLWGLGAAGAFDSARQFSRGLAIFYGALAVMGLIPWLNTTFGLIPIFGHDIWLHAVTAALAAYFGFGQPAGVAVEERWRKAS